MKILVTGAKGFIGKNLIAELKNRKYTDIFEFDQDTEPSLLNQFCNEAEFVFHLAGAYRPIDQFEFTDENVGFTSILINTLRKYKNTCPVMISSHIKEEQDGSEDEREKAGENLLYEYGIETGAKILVYRFPYIFGKWGRPNYNSVVITFCYNISRELPIHMNTPDVMMNLVYIDDVVDELIHALEGDENRVDLFCKVPTVYTITLGEIVDLIFSFKKSIDEESVPNMSDAFVNKLYCTYLSYLPED
jgi:UDP-2-acetamido-2,6-beta-L-arabino-hexul-4-ose reductase